MPNKQRLLSLCALLAFVVQTVAVVHASCPAMGNSSDAVAAMVHSDHSMHGMQSQDAKPGSAKPCCGDNDCPMMQCGIVFSAIVDSDLPRIFAQPAFAVINSGPGSPFALPASLFRPPISS